MEMNGLFWPLLFGVLAALLLGLAPGPLPLV